MQPLEHKAPSLSISDKKDEDIFRTRRQAWPLTPIATVHHHPFCMTRTLCHKAKHPSVQEDREEKESQSSSEEKV